MKKTMKIGLLSVALALLVLAVPLASGVVCPCNPGKVTGGGWFICACYGVRSNFGFNVVLYPEGDTHEPHYPDAPKGELEYQDHTLGLNIHAHDFLTLCVSEDKTKATFTGPCTINHEEGFSFKVYVEDNGEPGCANSGRGTDVFELWLYKGSVGSTDPWDYTGYHAVGHHIRGGNIQIHW